MTYANFGGIQPVTETARTSGWIAALRSAIANRMVFSRTVNELSALSNRELADLGLDRSMITSVAHEAAYGN